MCRNSRCLLAAALVAGGYAKRDATMGQMLGVLDEVISGTTLELMLMAPLAFTSDAYFGSRGSVNIEEPIDDALKHQMAVYQMLGGDLDSFLADMDAAAKGLGQLARQLDAARSRG